jgi:hypothetical protein
MNASRTNLRIDGRSMRQLSRRFKRITPKPSPISARFNAEGVADFSPVQRRRRSLIPARFNAEGVR